VAEQLGVALGGALVKLLDRAVTTHFFTKPRDESAAGGPCGEPRNRHASADSTVRHRFARIDHFDLLPYGNLIA
jgi:hypothetical protein